MKSEYIAFIGSILNLVYNIPQIYLTVKTKKARDISQLSLNFKLVSTLLWIYYSYIIGSFFMFFSNFISLNTTLIILYYKFFDKNK